MRSVVSSPAPTCHRRYKVGDGDPSKTLALDRLAVQGAVNVVSTWWASEGRRRRGGRGRRADAGTHTYHLRAHSHTCTHHQLPSRHPTPAAAAVYMGQDLHTSSGNTVGTTTTYGSPPYYVSHQHTHPPPLSLTCGPHCPSPVPAFKFAHSQPSISEVPPRQQKPNSSGSRRHSTTTNLTRPHYRYRPTHQHPPTPPAPCPSNTSGTHGQRPGSSPGR